MLKAVSDAPTLAAEISNASFAWPGGRGVDDVSLQIAPGQIVTLLGPNGAGKSTVLKLLSGEINPDRGSVQIRGRPHSPDVRRGIGLVLQEPSTDDLMTLEETLTLHGRLFGLRGAPLRERSAALLDALQIGDRAADRCETLSGGLRRRLDLARALLHEPELLLLDEPTLALDPDSSAAIWSALRERAADGAAIVVCSNDTSEAESNADRVVIINRGSIQAEGRPSQLTANLRRDALELEWHDASDTDIAALQAWNEIGSLLRSDHGLHLTVDSAVETVPRLFQQYGARISGIRIRESSLRDAWFQIVGVAISDAISDEEDAS